MDTVVVDLPSVEDSEYARAFGTKVGQGAFRAVFRIPGSDWAYKFDRTDDEAWFKDTPANITEMRNYLAHKDHLPKGVAFPEMIQLDNGAIAVKFVDGVLAGEVHEGSGRSACVCHSHGLSACWKILAESTNLSDMHGRNVMVHDRKVFIIDIGEFGG